MGTRSLTYIYDDNWDNDDSENPTPEPILCVYRQYDGYISGHGAQLANFLDGRVVKNDDSLLGSKGKSSNGMGELAAHFLMEFKQRDVNGNIYVVTPNKLIQSNFGQEYTYNLFENRVSVFVGNKNIFSGTWDEFKTFTVGTDEV